MNKQMIGEVFRKYETDKGPHRHGYHQMYSDVFKDGAPDSLLEIGIYEGRSLAAWRDLFPAAKIHGIDTFKRPNTLVYQPEDVKMITGNSMDPSFTQTIADVYDIIIDDGDHRPDAQWTTFLNFKNQWKKYYIVEDIATEENELIMRKRFKSVGLNNITTYRSAFRGNVQINKKIVNAAYFAMVIKKE